MRSLVYRHCPEPEYRPRPRSFCLDWNTDLWVRRSELTLLIEARGFVKRVVHLGPHVSTKEPPT
jgi:hypothetical protein